MFILKFLWILSHLCVGQSVKFVLSPSPNIGVYQLAHYQCSVDHTGVTVTWYINKTIFNDDSLVQLGIVTNGAGSSSSSLTISGYPQFNNTVVTCYVAGLVNGNLYNNFSESTLRMQGKLDEVVGLKCSKHNHCCLNCSWSPPFSLDGVPIYGYIINVTNDGDNTQYITTSNTTSWIYCPSQFGNYTVSIAGNNSAGEGDVTRQFTVLPKIYVTNWMIKSMNRSSNISWNLSIQVTKSQQCIDLIVFINIQLLKPYKTSLLSCSDQTMIELNLPENQILKIGMSLVYSSGLVITSNDTITLSTYDITGATLYNDLSNIGRTCYSCHFIRGAIVKGCLISLTSSTYRTNISLMCSPVCSSTVIGCTYDIPSGIYNMYAYDIEKEDTLSDDWAISSTNITITGLEPTCPSFEVICPVSTCPLSMVTITSKTCDCLTNDTQINKSFITATGSLVGVSVLILVSTVLVHIVICWIRRTKSLRQGTVPSPINPLTDTVPHQVIPQYENVDMITNTLPTTELEMNICTAYGVIK